MPLPIVLVMHQDGGERTGPVWDQQEGRDGSPVFVMVSDPEAVVVVFLDHGVRLERYGVMRYAELQKLTDFSAESINCHTCLKRARDTSLAVRIRSPNPDIRRGGQRERRQECTLEASGSRPMSGFQGLSGAFESFSPTPQGLDRPATGIALPYNSPTPFPIAGGNAPCRQSQDACEGRPSPARESVPASVPADSWLYYLQEPSQRIRHTD